MYSYRAASEARRREREAFERRGRRMFWIGLTVPAVACVIAALVIGPDSWIGWAAVLATAPAGAAGVAIAYAAQDWRSRSRP